MKPLKPATISEEEIIGTAKAWLELWKQGDLNTRKVASGDLSELDAFTVLLTHSREHTKGAYFLNDKYQVVRNLFECGDTMMVHLSIKTLDKTAEHDWREYQQIKNELIGPECEAVEIYPAESKLVDCANQFHLWGWLSPKVRLPFGFQERMVSEQGVHKSQQRPFNKE